MRENTVLTALAAATFALGIPAAGQAAVAGSVAAQPATSVIHYSAAKTEGLDVFYRRAGPIDSGHFALEGRGDETIPLIGDFLGRTLPTR